jgi:hypothetical protein
LIDVLTTLETPAKRFIFTGDLASRIDATMALWGDLAFGLLFKLSMDLLGSFGYAPSMASMALLTSINPLAISDDQHPQTTGGMEVS